MARDASAADARGIQHGTYNRYANYGCRCDECRKAKADRQAAYREANRDRLREYNKAYAATHPNLGEAQAMWRRGNRAKVREAQKRSVAVMQERSSARAHRRGLEWTGPELEVAARSDLGATEVAEILGRTFQAVKAIRKRLKRDPRIIALAGSVPDPRPATVAYIDSEVDL